jgi:transposase
MIGELDQKIEALMLPFSVVLEKLVAIPGVSRHVAQMIIAEIGIDMKPFPTAEHLASWASICPGNHESGGKRKSGRTRQGNPWLKAALAEAGWAASHTKKNVSVCALPQDRAPPRKETGHSRGRTHDLEAQLPSAFQPR